jgi:hypothetical protein
MKRVSMIVTSDYVQKARELAVQLGFADAPEHIFLVQLSATGLAPATHYGLSTAWSEAGAALLAPTEYQEDNEIISPPDIDGLMQLYDLPSEMKLELEDLFSHILLRVSSSCADAFNQFNALAASVELVKIVEEAE